mmetsp:Transcript_41744/g.82430  ORF Transcript_41744/g.82430 Transcript_41744/m.82430 type:complete len:115 (+) Transcript_41744:475-819(+)
MAAFSVRGLCPLPRFSAVPKEKDTLVESLGKIKRGGTLRATVVYRRSQTAVRLPLLCLCVKGALRVLRSSLCPLLAPLPHPAEKERLPENMQTPHSLMEGREEKKDTFPSRSSM